jgi:hypothetical protein
MAQLQIGGLPFFGLRRPSGSLSCEWVAAPLLPGRSYPQYQAKRRHPFERQRTWRGWSGELISVDQGNVTFPIEAIKY